MSMMPVDVSTTNPVEISVKGDLELARVGSVQAWGEEKARGIPSSPKKFSPLFLGGVVGLSAVAVTGIILLALYFTGKLTNSPPSGSPSPLLATDAPGMPLANSVTFMSIGDWGRWEEDGKGGYRSSTNQMAVAPAMGAWADALKAQGNLNFIMSVGDKCVGTLIHPFPLCLPLCLHILPSTHFAPPPFPL